MTQSDYNYPEDPAGSPSPWKSLVTLILMAVLVVVLFRFLMAFIIPLLSLVLLVANRDLVGRLFRTIVQLYQEEMYKGLLATIAAVVLFTPFLVFLFFRTIYYLFVNPSAADGRIVIHSEESTLDEQMKRVFREDNRRSF